MTRFPNYVFTEFLFIKIPGISEYLVYAHGGTVTSVFVHIFAIVFLFIRKSLERKYNNN